MNERQFKFLMRFTGNRIKVRKMLTVLNRKNHGKKFTELPPPFNKKKCGFCLENPADKQLAKTYGMAGNKKVVVGWAWACDECIKDAKRYHKPI